MLFYLKKIVLLNTLAKVKTVRSSHTQESLTRLGFNMRHRVLVTEDTTYIGHETCRTTS